MKSLLEKLNYKGQKRIAVINAEEAFISSIKSDVTGIVIDQKIDPRFPYEFAIIFAKSSIDIDTHTPMTLHNLTADGILWYCYPKKTSKKYKSDIDRDHGWKLLNASGLYGIRIVAVDKDWSALRFRNKKFIKSSSPRLEK